MRNPNTRRNMKHQSEVEIPKLRYSLDSNLDQSDSSLPLEILALGESFRSVEKNAISHVTCDVGEDHIFSDEPSNLEDKENSFEWNDSFFDRDSSYVMPAEVFDNEVDLMDSTSTLARGFSTTSSLTLSKGGRSFSSIPSLVKFVPGTGSFDHRQSPVPSQVALVHLDEIQEESDTEEETIVSPSSFVLPEKGGAPVVRRMSDDDMPPLTSIAFGPDSWASHSTFITNSLDDDVPPIRPGAKRPDSSDGAQKPTQPPLKIEIVADGHACASSSLTRNSSRASSTHAAPRRSRSAKTSVQINASGKRVRRSKSLTATLKMENKEVESKTSTADKSKKLTSKAKRALSKSFSSLPVVSFSEEEEEGNMDVSSRSLGDLHKSRRNSKVSSGKPKNESSEEASFDWEAYRVALLMEKQKL